MRDDRSWIQTYTGKQFWPLDPRPEDIDIIDIAHALSQTCRYTGHTRSFYSVAQHSVLASMIVPPEDAFWGLMHDASEAYLADVARPVKRLLTNYKDAEAKLMKCVAERFGLPWPEPASIGGADLVLLATERRDLMATPPRPWISTAGVEPMTRAIYGQDAVVAEGEFLARFAELAGVEVG